MLKRFKEKNFSVSDIIYIIIISVIILSTIFFYTYKAQTKKNSHSMSVELEKYAFQDETNLNNYTVLSVDIAKNPDVLFQIQQINSNPDSIYELGSYLNKYKNMLSSIQDIIIYNSNNNSLYFSDSTSCILDDYANPNLIEELKKAPLNRKQTVTTVSDTRMLQNSGNICYIYSGVRNANDAIIVNVSDTALKNNYISLNSQVIRALIVTNDVGAVVYNNNNIAFGKSIANESFFINRNHDNISFQGIFNKEKVIFDYHYSEYCKRWYIGITEKDAVLTQCLTDTNFILLCIIFFVIIFLVYYLIKHMLYLKQKASSYIKTIQHDWNNNLFNTTQANRENKNQLYNFVSKKHYNYEDFIQYLPPEFPQENLGMIFVHIPIFSDLSEKDIQLYRYGINNICTEIFCKYGYCCNIFAEENKLIYLIGNIQKSQYEETATQAAKFCKENIYEYIQADVSFYISSLYEFENLHEAFLETYKIADYKYLYNEGVFSSSMLKPNDSSKNEQCLNLCQQITQQILSGKEAVESFTELKVFLYDMNIENVKNVLQHFNVYLYNTLNTLKKRNEIDNNTDIDLMLSRLKNAYTLDEYSSVFADICSVIKNKREQLNKDSHSTIVSKVLKIIEEEYKNEALNVEYIADKTGMSPSYIRKIFKQKYNMSIADKITEIRLIEAERLLSQTDKTVKEIMISLGFANQSYFTTLFKKKYNVVPSLYRRSVKK